MNEASFSHQQIKITGNETHTVVTSERKETEAGIFLNLKKSAFYFDQKTEFPEFNTNETFELKV